MKKSAFSLCLITVVLVLPFLFTSGFALTVMIQCGVAIVFALAFNMLLGQGGMLSFGHAVYFGLAGYVTAHVMNGAANQDLPYIPVTLIPLVGGFAGLFFGILIGFVSTRRAGTSFAMISLGIAELVTGLTLILVVFFNGEEGIQTDRWIKEEWFGITYGPDIQVYYLVAAWCLLAAVVMYLITRTPFGRMCNAIRDNPERVEFVGYSTHRLRWLAFSLSSFFAGLAGALHAVNLEHIGFETVGLGQSAIILIMVYIGGTGVFFGPVLGAILVTLLTSYLSDITPAWYLYLGCIFVIMVMFAPGGIAGLIAVHDPIRQTSFRLFVPMIPNYFAALCSTTVTLVGSISMIEMLYHMSVNRTGKSIMLLYGYEIDTASFWPWFICIGFLILGYFACRWSYRNASSSFSSAIDIARKSVI